MEVLPLHEWLLLAEQIKVLPIKAEPNKKNRW
jgi:hypothetical protein